MGVRPRVSLLDLDRGLVLVERGTNRLAYASLVDFVPDVPPYEFQTDVDLEPSEEGVTVTMKVEPMHDQVWTERLLAGLTNELDNLARVIEQRGTA